MPRKKNPPREIPAPSGDWFTVQQIGRYELHCGTRSIYHAIARGELRASEINERGDLRVHRSWLLQWLEGRAANVPTLRKVAG